MLRTNLKQELVREKAHVSGWLRGLVVTVTTFRAYVRRRCDRGPPESRSRNVKVRENRPQHGSSNGMIRCVGIRDDNYNREEDDEKYDNLTVSFA